MKKNSFENIYKSFKKNNFKGACAIGLHTDKGYNHKDFFQQANRFGDFFFPVASINPFLDIEEEINEIRKIGYKAIKIHPRLSNINFEKDFNILDDIFKFALGNNLIVFFCTYYHDKIEFTPPNGLFPIIVQLLKNNPKTKLVLLHGGDIQLMQYVQLARFNKNILIDLSYTIMKFKNSSLELDFRFLFQNFEQKICIGTDSPEYEPEELQARLEEIGKHVTDKTKLERIASSNIMKFLGIE